MKVLIGQHGAVQAKILTGTLVKKGYSPFMNEETGTWWEYDDSLNAFIDTGVSIVGEKGDPGDVGPKGDPGEKGEKGDGVYTVDVSETLVDGGGNFITFSDGTILEVHNGNRGSEGPRGVPVLIEGIDESTEDNMYSYVFFDDGHTLAVKNGKTGAKGDKGDKGDPAEITQADLDRITQELTDSLSKNKYTPEGTITAPTVNVIPNATKIALVESVGTLPSMGADTFTAGSFTEGAFNPGTLPSKAADFFYKGAYTAPSFTVTCDTDGITHFSFAAGSYTAPSFTEGAFDAGSLPSKAADKFTAPTFTQGEFVAGTLPVIGNDFAVLTGISSATATAPEFTGKTKSIIE